MITKPERVEHRLPHQVFAYINKHFANGAILDMQEVKRSTGKVNYYKVDVVDDDGTYHLRFDPKGKLMKEVVEAATEEELPVIEKKRLVEEELEEA